VHLSIEISLIRTKVNKFAEIALKENIYIFYTFIMFIHFLTIENIFYFFYRQVYMFFGSICLSFFSTYLVNNKF